jgi:hypothetical protein
VTRKNRNIRIAIRARAKCKIGEEKGLAGLYDGLSGSKAGTKTIETRYNFRLLREGKRAHKGNNWNYTNITQPIHISPSLIAKKQCKDTHTVDKFY